jgi:hypothetical protein
MWWSMRGRTGRRWMVWMLMGRWGILRWHWGEGCWGGEEDGVMVDVRDMIAMINAWREWKFRAQHGVPQHEMIDSECYIQRATL